MSPSQLASTPDADNMPDAGKNDDSSKKDEDKTAVVSVEASAKAQKTENDNVMPQAKATTEAQKPAAQK